MQYTVEKTSTINLGKQGEHLARRLTLPDIAAWEAEYGPGEAEIIFLPPGEGKPIAIAPVRTEDGAWLWAVTATETACPGYGKCELRYAAGDAVMKSVTYQTYVAESLEEGVSIPKTGPDDVWQEDPTGMPLLTDKENGTSYALVVEGGKLMMQEAAGDKKPVVMESDLTVPGGVATLDENGKLEESQCLDCSIDQIEGLEEVLESLADKGTLDKVKEDTAAIMEKSGTIEADAASIKATAETILKELREERPKRYGYRVKIAEPNPSDRVEYLFDAVGMTPAHMDYDRQEFDYGDWKDIWFVRDNYPCMVRSDGSEDYRLDPGDYTKKLADGAASDVSNQQYEGNAMAAIPLVWVSRYQEGGYQYVIFCEQQYDESYKAYAHTRPDGTIAKHAYHALFKGSMVETKLRSIAGDSLFPQSGTQASAELAAAKANGAKWSIRTWAIQSLIADLCTLISKSCSSQEAFGQGHTEGGTAAASFLACGTLKDKGQFFGYSDTAHAMKVFHIENFWGDRWDRLAGLIYKNGAFRVKMTPEGTGYDLTGEGYTAIGKGITGQTAVNGSGWQRDTEQTEYGRFPVVPLTGSDAAFETDYLYWNNTITAVALAGGACYIGSWCGARCLHLDAAGSTAHWIIGASLTLEDPY